jgi:hypothetical protein
MGVDHKFQMNEFEPILNNYQIRKVDYQYIPSVEMLICYNQDNNYKLKSNYLFPYKQKSCIVKGSIFFK